MDIKPFAPACGCNDEQKMEHKGLTSFTPFILSSPALATDDTPCCGPPAGPASSPHERAGYAICPYVDGFVMTTEGFAPRVKTDLSVRDTLSNLLVRLNVNRNTHKVAPGLYAVGHPDASSPVLVTANYKLTFDHVRSHLKTAHAFILVLDTRGINVWCAAGKKTFGTEELVNRIRQVRLSGVVSHRNIILPQLGAAGVSAMSVKKQTGFSVIWGPVSSQDIPSFMADGMKARPEMRRLSFNLAERLILVPVELSIAAKPAVMALLALAVLSGFGPGFFSFTAFFQRGITAGATLLAGVVAGAVFTPAFLNRLPGSFFSIKGAVAGLVLTIPTALAFSRSWGISGFLGLVFVSTAVSSWLAMNFTGATPFTSPSGVEKEMKRSMPFQIGAVVAGLILWMMSAYK